MRNQRFENKKQERNTWHDYNDNIAKKHKMASHKNERNWKNKLFKEDDDKIDDNFFHFDDEN
ncbi:MAG: hypothetical protein BWX95_01928 [Bacteroidetes bacterium ADurb.Bin141]|nr:MAG: hypothetical protein UZ10_BCD003001432 [Bacteroidetes bacterium OLB10]MBV6453361.1 hypothetical protein [Bacteroidia bacterium]MBX3105314.1 hypothetical protein [Bacteroidota bacterium]OQB61279.1 MAG: hypothetical protein BWX95_01928 [Bacteroidetes bacterium ADurb.Bin141]MCB8930935.1 hypothetical protein [Bacteroidia bacterium]